MLCHISGLLTSDDIPEHEDEEVRDATTVDFISEELLKTIRDIGGVYRPGFMTKFQAE